MAHAHKDARKKTGKTGSWATRSASSGKFMASFVTKGGKVDIEQVSRTFKMSKVQLAETAGLGKTTVTKVERRESPKAQSRMTEMLEILVRVRGWAGSEAQAMAWYRAEPIPALDRRTAEALVKSGQANAVREYLDHLALGGFA